MEEQLKRILVGLGIDPSDLEGFDPHTFTLPESVLPKQRVDGLIRTRSGQSRCTLDYKKIINNGQYGLIQKAIRTPGSQELTVKRPRSTKLSLQPEAILQSLCHSVVERHGLHNSIPRVHDLFLFANETRFSMDFVDGTDYMTFLRNNCSEAQFMNSILQLCYILYVLETDIGFDHRDLNTDNIWVRRLPAPITYSLEIHGTKFSLQVLNQIVLLDFGFACVGNLATRLTKLSLGGVIPPLDPCPKDGRDMYQILNRLLTQPFIRNSLSVATLSQLLNSMHPYHVEEPSLTQILTSMPQFGIIGLTPKFLIQAFSSSGVASTSS